VIDKNIMNSLHLKCLFATQENFMRYLVNGPPLHRAVIQVNQNEVGLYLKPKTDTLTMSY
jgi:hypothetical protein